MPPELAMAYVITRPLVKLRLPVEVGVAGLLAKLCPPLTQIKCSALLGVMPTGTRDGAWVRKRGRSGDQHTSQRRAWGRLTATVRSSPRRPKPSPHRLRRSPVPSYPPMCFVPAEPDTGRLASVLAKVRISADHYGAALYISRDIVGVSSLVTLATGLRMGLDLSSYLPQDSGLVVGAASLSGAALVASSLSPLYLLSMGHAVPKIMQIPKAYTSRNR